MKTKLLRVLVAAVSIAAVGFLAISPSRAQGSSGGGGAGCCGGSSGDDAGKSNNSGAVNMVCGQGTHQAGNQCVRN